MLVAMLTVLDAAVAPPAPIWIVLELAFVPILIWPVLPVSRLSWPVVAVIILRFLAAAVVISVPIVPLNMIPFVAVPAVFVKLSKLVVVPPAVLRLISTPLV